MLFKRTVTINDNYQMKGMKMRLQRGIASPYVNHSCEAQAINDTTEAPATHQTQPEIYLLRKVN